MGRHDQTGEVINEGKELSDLLPRRSVPDADPDADPDRERRSLDGYPDPATDRYVRADQLADFGRRA